MQQTYGKKTSIILQTPSGSRHISHSEVLNDVLLRPVPEVFEHARY